MAVIFNTAAGQFNGSNIGSADAKWNAIIGKYEAPLKMIIQHESDLYAKKDAIADTLFNVFNSNKYAESFVMQKEFDMFEDVPEGGKAPTTDYGNTRAKIISAHQFMNQFIITANMMEDALTNQSALAAQNFVRSYYKTRNLFASKMFTNLGTSLTFNKGSFDTTTADGVALWHKTHYYGDGASTQSNRYSLKLASNSYVDVAAVEEAITACAEAIRNMKDENGYSLGYTADTIVIPGNDHKLEAAMRKVLGSEFSSNASGALSGAINTQYGQFTLVVNPFWQRGSTATSHPFIITSSEANSAICGATFIDRVPLTVSDRVDQDTANYIWTGRARMSAGFVNYKFGCYCEVLDNNTTTLQDGGAHNTNSTEIA